MAPGTKTPLTCSQASKYSSDFARLLSCLIILISFCRLVCRLISSRYARFRTSILENDSLVTGVVRLPFFWVGLPRDVLKYFLPDVALRIFYSPAGAGFQPEHRRCGITARGGLFESGLRHLRPGLHDPQ